MLPTKSSNKDNATQWSEVHTTVDDNLLTDWRFSDYYIFSPTCIMHELLLISLNILECVMIDLHTTETAIKFLLPQSLYATNKLTVMTIMSIICLQACIQLYKAFFSRWIWFYLMMEDKASNAEFTL